MWQCFWVKSWPESAFWGQTVHCCDLHPWLHFFFLGSYVGNFGRLMERNIFFCLPFAEVGGHIHTKVYIYIFVSRIWVELITTLLYPLYPFVSKIGHTFPGGCRHGIASLEVLQSQTRRSKLAAHLARWTCRIGLQGCAGRCSGEGLGPAGRWIVDNI